MTLRRPLRSRASRSSGVAARTLIACICGLSIACPCLGADAAAQASDEPAFELIEADIAAVQAAFDAGALSSAALTQAYLDRIEQLDQSGPRLNTLLEVSETAADSAAALDAERGQSKPRGPLHGIPILVRDDLDTIDLSTTAGSATLRGHEPLADAFVVGRLRAAGAVVLGKANLSELGLALGRLGYSSAGGQTRNPYNLRRAPSFAGDAAAVAANLAMAAVGTDTLGSLRGPAAATGMVGLKPTPGLTSRSGAVPTARSVQVAGPLARSVRDVALLLGVIAGAEDAKDPLTAEAPERDLDFAAMLDETALDGARLGVASAYRRGNKEVDRAFDAALELLRKQGAVLVNVAVPEAVLGGWDGILDRLLETEFKDQLDAYLINTEQGMPHSLAELLRMSESPLIAGSETPVSPRHLDTYRRVLASAGLADLEYLDILSRRLPAARAEVRGLFSEHELDAIVFPTMLCPASSLLDDYDASYDCDADDPYQPAYLASIAGLPELTLPMGQTAQGLPIGLSLAGPAFSEGRLMALGFAFEQAAGARKPPELPAAPPAISGGESAQELGER